MARPVETIADQLFYTTIYIETQNDEVGATGTGFLVEYETDRGLMPVLVTNKHVFEGAKIARFRAVATAPQGGPSQRATRVSVEEFNSPGTWVPHPDPNVDVAVFPFGAVQRQMAKQGARAFTKAFAADIFLTERQARELDAIESVLFVGYPSGLYDTASWLPVARRGQTATPIYNDYKHLPSFLIDASVFPGSSGSPVVLYDRGMYVDRTGAANIGSRFHLIGVVASVHTRQVRGELVVTQNAPVPTFDDVIDLGLVFKASAIQTCVDVLMDRVDASLSSAPAKDDLA